MGRTKLNQNETHAKEIVSEDFGELDTTEKWVQSFMQFGSVHAYKELERNFESNVTHSGLIYYLHYCWAKEIGCVIRPDMIWHTVVSEIASAVLKNPSKYKYLFSDTDEKQEIVVLTSDITDINVDTLTNEISKIIKNKKFMDVICDTRFKSEEENAHLAVQMTFACMATPFFSYMTTRCGIPSIDVKGDFTDWYKIIKSLEILKTELKDDEMEKYINDVRNVVGNIILDSDLDNTFGELEIEDHFDDTFSLHYIKHKDEVGERIRRIRNIKHNSPEDRFYKSTFLNDIFRYGKNEICMSGHSPRIVRGWITKLYMHGNENDLFQFNKHINYVPYKNIESELMFCKVVGLTHSEYDKKSNVLNPKYGIIKYQITDETIYNKLAK